VDCENNHATGAKPMSNTVIKSNSPATSPAISPGRAVEPLKPAKM